jgi:hypothetical protein
VLPWEKKWEGDVNEAVRTNLYAELGPLCILKKNKQQNCSRNDNTPTSPPPSQKCPKQTIKNFPPSLAVLCPDEKCKMLQEESTSHKTPTVELEDASDEQSQSKDEEQEVMEEQPQELEDLESKDVEELQAMVSRMGQTVQTMQQALEARAKRTTEAAQQTLPPAKQRKEAEAGEKVQPNGARSLQEAEDQLVAIPDVLEKVRAHMDNPDLGIDSVLLSAMVHAYVRIVLEQRVVSWESTDAEWFKRPGAVITVVNFVDASLKFLRGLPSRARAAFSKFTWANMGARGSRLALPEKIRGSDKPFSRKMTQFEAGPRAWESFDHATFWVQQHEEHSPVDLSLEIRAHLRPSCSCSRRFTLHTQTQMWRRPGQRCSRS